MSVNRYQPKAYLIQDIVIQREYSLIILGKQVHHPTETPLEPEYPRASAHIWSRRVPKALPCWDCPAGYICLDLYCGVLQPLATVLATVTGYNMYTLPLPLSCIPNQRNCGTLSPPAGSTHGPNRQIHETQGIPILPFMTSANMLVMTSPFVAKASW